jgi:hypothetical protein
MEPTLPTRTKYSPAAIAELLSTKTRPLAMSPGNQDLAAARAMARHGMHADNQHRIRTRRKRPTCQLFVPSEGMQECGGLQ